MQHSAVAVRACFCGPAWKNEEVPTTFVVTMTVESKRNSYLGVLRIHMQMLSDDWSCLHWTQLALT